MRKDKILNQKGLALVTVFFIFLVALIVVGAIAIISVTEVGTTRTNQEAEQAFNLAEAGIDWAKAQLAANYTYSTTGLFINTPNIGSSGSALVKVDNSVGTSTWNVTITAKGFVSGTASRAIQNVMQIKLSHSQSPFNASVYWHRALHSEGKISGTGSGEVIVDGDVPLGPTVQSNWNESNKDQSIDFAANIRVEGSPGLGYVYPAEPPDRNPDHYTFQAVATDTIPTMDFNYWRELAKKAGTFSKIDKSGSDYNLNGGYVTGDIKISGSGTLNGIYFAEGDIDLSGSYKGDATFISAKEIDMSGSMEVGNGNVALIAKGKIDISGTQDITGLVYSSTKVEFSGSPIFYGSITSQGSIEFSGGGEIHYRGGSDQGGVIPGMGTGTTTATSVTSTPISWQEVAVTP